MNGNESESTCDDDCVVPSLPQDELMSKQSPQQHQQHETVLRMNNSLSNYKHDSVFKSEPDNPYKSERTMEFKTEIPEDNNNNRLRLTSYDDDDVRYAAQAEDAFRYNSHPESNSFRYGAESNNSRFEESLRLGSQGYSPKPSYRDYWRDSYREGFPSRSDFHQRLSAMQDYYLQRSMASQDRYPGVIGYSRSDPASRFGYPRFDYSSRAYNANRYEAAKAEGYPSPSAFESRSEFQRPNEKYFRSPSDYSPREEYTTLKSGEEVPRSTFNRNSLPPKSSSDEFVKPTVSRSEFSSRQNSAGRDFSLKSEKTSTSVSSSSINMGSNGNSVISSNIDRCDRDQVTNDVKEKEAEDKGSKGGLIELKSSQKTDINGNTGKVFSIDANVYN